MEFKFWKYQATGNDFIMLDGREEHYEFSPSQILKICDRRFGIGADGLIILQHHSDYDFEMDYYNADGSKSFCGNGSRCVQAFVEQIGMIADKCSFLAIDGAHEGKKTTKGFATKMKDVNTILKHTEDLFIDTGSPHYIRFVEDLSQIDVEKEGRLIRNSPDYKKNGVNVNFVEERKEGIAVRTYERGVEAETYSCGTGVTAAAIAHLYKNQLKNNSIAVETRGGELVIQLLRTADTKFENIWLEGPAKLVFSGSYPASHA